MRTRRTPFALAVAALSLGMLAACSDERNPAVDAQPDRVTPPPANAPMDTTPAPGAGIPTPPPVDSAPPVSPDSTGPTSGAGPGSGATGSGG